MKAHSDNVQQRVSRVIKYGQSSLSVPGAISGASDNKNDPTKQSYAMFNPTKRKAKENSNDSNMNSELRRRHGAGSGLTGNQESENKSRFYSSQSPYQPADGPSNEPSSNDPDSDDKKRQHKLKSSKSRQEAALKVETSVREVK